MGFVHWLTARSQLNLELQIQKKYLEYVCGCIIEDEFFMWHKYVLVWSIRAARISIWQLRVLPITYAMNIGTNNHKKTLLQKKWWNGCCALLKKWQVAYSNLYTGADFVNCDSVCLILCKMLLSFECRDSFEINARYFPVGSDFGKMIILRYGIK